MKKTFLLFATLLMTIFASAQVSNISTDLHGSFEITIGIDDIGSITIDAHGKILNSELYGDHKYYSDFNDYEEGKIMKVAHVNFSYYPNRNAHEAGKIKQIGSITFSYHSGAGSHADGKIKQIGDVTFSYYPNVNDYEAGKLKQVGSTRFAYYPKTNGHEAGKIKQIGDISYTYFTDDEYKGTKRAGQMKTGRNQFDMEEITFMIIL